MTQEKIKKGLALGVGLIIVGVIGLLVGLNVFPENIEDYIVRWESLVILIGLLLIFVRKKLVAGFVMISVGSYFLVDEIFYMSEKFEIYYWPIMLILLGVLLLFSNKKFLNNKCDC